MVAATSVAIDGQLSMSCADTSGGMMARLEELTKGAVVRGVLGDRKVRVVDVSWHGADTITLTYTDELTGRADQELLYRDDESRLIVDEAGRAWSMDADGNHFRLVSEAKRISLAHLFDPFLAVQTSDVDPLPHQIDAVYNKMLPRQPLRFLLADDPGAGKTIMAGLLCKELIIRGDVDRCLIIAPGSLVGQWQDELWQKFALDFTILTRDMIEASRSGNPFTEEALLIARLDHLSRNEDLQAKLQATDWDLVIVDEAHKMSAHRIGGEIKETKRYKLGRLAGSVARNFLLMTATPHAGIDEDFHLFLALLDSDRFEGRPRDGARTVDVSDIMRRLVKEGLLTFDGKPLFPERRAYTAVYPLSEGEALLYKLVTEYVQDEMNRADRLKAAGEGRRGAIVGFALTTLQRRLASSPEAIYQSLRRRRQRLESRVAEERQRRRGAGDPVTAAIPRIPGGPGDSSDDFDADDLPPGELEDLEEQLVDEASAAGTIAELDHEIVTLVRLEELAYQLRDRGSDRKWDELSDLLRRAPEMFNADGSRRKLIVFSEHRDTLNYLVGRLRALLGRADSVVTIHGGVPREERRKIQEAFANDKDVLVLVATDAAGEGINLQRAHLMVNYDLPWNPNRIEQRFGRIHRIGQTEVCHLWNLVAEDTREGQVFQRLFDKLDEQRRALGGQVFDVLGETFRDKSLRELLIDAVRYGDKPEVKARLDTVLDATVGEALRQVIHERALVSDLMTEEDIERIRDELDRAQVRRLQPHFIRPFFLEALTHLGGAFRERGPGRFEITSVPAEIRLRDRQSGRGAAVLRRYERVTFDKDLIAGDSRATAEFLAPGHPLVDGTIDLIAERLDGVLKQGAVLIDDTGQTDEPRVLVYLQHAVVDGRVDRSGNRRTVSKRFEFVEVNEAGLARSAGWAPYLDVRSATATEIGLATSVIQRSWVRSSLEEAAITHGIELARHHLAEVRRRTLQRVDRTTEAIRSRLEPEIAYWDHRARQLRERETAGKLPSSGMNSARARQRADELTSRLRHRLHGLDEERQLASTPPVVTGGALVIPAGLLVRSDSGSDVAGHRGNATARQTAVRAVIAAERTVGRVPAVLATGHQGYDLESHAPDGTPVFLTVRWGTSATDTFTVTRSEIGVARNAPDYHVLALVDLDRQTVRYLRRALCELPEPLFGLSSVKLSWQAWFGRGEVAS
jgi:SNF2 family DNA or RNA helicase